MTTAFQSSLKYDLQMQQMKVGKDERYDLLQLKGQLAEALGDDGPSYWEALRKFVQGKLNRQEFDFYANLYLPDNKAQLHNRFILATIHNAQTPVLPPSGQRSEGFKPLSSQAGADGMGGKSGARDSSGGAGGNKRNVKVLLEDPQWRRIKEMVKSLSKPERRTIKQLLKRPNMTPKAAEEAIRKLRPVVLPLPISQLPPTYPIDMAKGVMAPLCYDTKSTPDAEALRHRMIALALENGLNGGVTESSVGLLLCALDSHLKSVISNTIYKVRSNRSLGIPVSSEVPDLIRSSATEPNAEKSKLIVAGISSTGASINPESPNGVTNGYPTTFTNVLAAGGDVLNINIQNNKIGSVNKASRSDICSNSSTAGNDHDDEPQTPPDTALQEHILNGNDDLLSAKLVTTRPTVGGLRLRERLYRSKTTVRLADFDFSLNMCPYITVEMPFCLERIVHWLSHQETANPNNVGIDMDYGVGNDNEGEGGGSGPHDNSNDTAADAVVGSDGNAINGTPSSSSNAVSGRGRNGRRKAEDSVDVRERKRLKQLRERYSRWFGPYVSTVAVPRHDNDNNGGENAA
ncbi:hypothetical protein H4219_005394 [Mycoemilia scoparia]|uniref:Uncharacterized protein n=1 Tax=Mycoemilia scoparia TaxID=417184 RepID=A0A9W7ZXT4_9FUNG|nr:hypothetical protein H4219_005394 [Mycoemilia scoparia]